METRIILTQVVIENIANILGDTNEGFTGSEIHNFLIQSQIEDIDPTNTKRIRLYNAFAASHNKEKCSNENKHCTQNSNNANDPSPVDHRIHDASYVNLKFSVLLILFFAHIRTSAR